MCVLPVLLLVASPHVRALGKTQRLASLAKFASGPWMVYMIQHDLTYCVHLCISDDLLPHGLLHELLLACIVHTALGLRPRQATGNAG